MKLIEAIIRPEKTDAVRKALDNAGYPGMTKIPVKGRGTQGGITLQHRAGEHTVPFLPKTKLHIVAKNKDVETIITIIQNTARTGQKGDGKIFIMDAENAVRVRTHDIGPDAL